MSYATAVVFQVNSHRDDRLATPAQQHLTHPEIQVYIFSSLPFEFAILLRMYKTKIKQCYFVDVICTYNSVNSIIKANTKTPGNPKCINTESVEKHTILFLYTLHSQTTEEGNSHMCMPTFFFPKQMKNSAQALLCDAWYILCSLCSSS